MSNQSTLVIIHKKTQQTSLFRKFVIGYFANLRGSRCRNQGVEYPMRGGIVSGKLLFVFPRHAPDLFVRLVA